MLSTEVRELPEAGDQNFFLKSGSKQAKVSLSSDAVPSLKEVSDKSCTSSTGNLSTVREEYLINGIHTLGGASIKGQVRSAGAIFNGRHLVTTGSRGIVRAGTGTRLEQD